MGESGIGSELSLRQKRVDGVGDRSHEVELELELEALVVRWDV